MVIARRHDAGGARIEQPRKKTCSTTIAWPQCAHTKVGAGVVDASSADAAHAGADVLGCHLQVGDGQSHNPPGQVGCPLRADSRN